MINRWLQKQLRKDTALVVPICIVMLGIAAGAAVWRKVWRMGA